MKSSDECFPYSQGIHYDEVLAQQRAKRMETTLSPYNLFLSKSLSGRCCGHLAPRWARYQGALASIAPDQSRSSTRRLHHRRTLN